MLTISKPLSASQAQNYHAKEFTAKEQNYWSQRGEIQGEWQGRLASQFGLAGAVSAEDFAKLSQGQHPATGEQLVRQRASYEYKDADGKTVKTMEHRAGWDATFSAPKSVSLTALVGGDENVRIAHCVFRSMWAPDSIRSGHQFLFDVGSNSVVMWAAFSDLP